MRDGKAAIVLDTGAVSRGSGNANKNKEKEARRYFVENDLIEGVIYLPENLFYNTNAPGIILVLNNCKAEERRNKLFLVNASLSFEKGDPKNFIPAVEVNRIGDVFLRWEEVERFSRIVTLEEVAKNDFNISPSRYIHVAEAEEFRPIAEILGELEALESKAEETNKILMQVLGKYK